MLNRAIELERKSTIFSIDETSIIIQSRKTFLLSDGELWIRKDDEDDFDVPMGCHNGAELREMVARNLLNQLNAVITKENIGLCREDGLGIFKNMSGPEVKRRHL